MSYTIDPGYTVPVATKNVAVYDIDYSDYTNPVVAGNDNHRTIKFQNKTSPLDRPMKIELHRDFIENAYKGTGVNPVNQSAVKTGMTLKMYISTVKAITDSATGEVIYIPQKFSQSYFTVLHPAIDATEVLKDLKINWGHWFPTDSVTANQIADMLAGGPGMLDETSD